MLLRTAEPEDALELAQVFYAAVRDGPSPYTDAQRRAWVSEVPSGIVWADRLAKMHVIVVEVDRKVAGFISVEKGGHIDLVFIRSEHQRNGLFRQLYQGAERWAREQGEPRLWTYASLMAEPAFQAMGFLVIHRETVARRGQNLARAKMEKSLT